MPTSHRKTTSPARPARHNPTREAYSRTTQPWVGSPVITESGTTSALNIILDQYRSQSGDTLNDWPANTTANILAGGVYVRTADGVTHAPTNLTVDTDLGSAIFEFDLTGYNTEFGTFLVEPWQKMVVLGGGIRLAAMAYNFAIPA